MVFGRGLNYFDDALLMKALQRYQDSRFSPKGHVPTEESVRKFAVATFNSVPLLTWLTAGCGVVCP